MRMGEGRVRMRIDLGAVENVEFLVGQDGVDLKRQHMDRIQNPDGIFSRGLGQRLGRHVCRLFAALQRRSSCGGHFVVSGAIAISRAGKGM